jgi:hypothetical protein
MNIKFMDDYNTKLFVHTYLIAVWCVTQLVKRVTHLPASFLDTNSLLLILRLLKKLMTFYTTVISWQCSHHPTSVLLYLNPDKYSPQTAPYFRKISLYITLQYSEWPLPISFPDQNAKLNKERTVKPLYQLTAFRVRLFRKFSLFIRLYVKNNVHILAYTRIYVRHNQLNKIPRQIYFRLSRYRKTVFLGALAKLRKVTISFVMPVYLFAPLEEIDLQRRNFHEIWIWGFFENPSRKLFFLLKSDNNNRHFT